MGLKKTTLGILVCLLHWSALAQISHPPFQYKSKDSVVTVVSDRYQPHSFLRYFFMGKNYRKEWAAPVTLPVFRLSETSFKVVELGGGMQTKSLKLEDKDGKAWALRTIDKDVSGAMPRLLKNSFAQHLTQDEISAAMPYGVPVVGALAKTLNIRAAQPVIYFVADDTALQKYSVIFANTVCMLEERDPGFETTIETESLLRKLQKDVHVVVDQKALLKARLLDMLIADWDRHYDNWRWGSRDSLGLTFFEAVPRDRDWAFYYSNGLVPKIMRFAALHFLVNFSQKPRQITNLSKKAHILDGMFLNGLNEDDWRTSVLELQQTLSDEAIEAAVKTLPPSIFLLDSARFVQTLKGRRDGLLKPVLQYYRFLAKEVQIDGTAGDETFLFLPADNGFVLQIFQQQKEDSNKRIKIYERRFLRSETYRVVINGLGGDDYFVLDKNISTSIKLKLNGGTGNDTYDLHGNLPVEVHDAAAENNSVTKTNSAKIYFR